MRSVKNKVCFVWLLIFLCGLTTVVGANNNIYPDVSLDYKYYKSINVLTAEEVIEGYPDATFKPDQPINRVEALKVILKAFNKNDTELIDVDFSDIEKSEWYYKHIQQGVKHEIVEGYVDGTFKPSNQVLLSESLKMGLVAKGYDLSTVEFEDVHPSVVVDDWYAKHFTVGLKSKFVDLDVNGGLNPNRPMNRGEFVDLIYRMRATDIGAEFDISYNWQKEQLDNGLLVEYPFDWQRFSLGEGLFLAYFAGQDPVFIKTVKNGARISINFWNNSEKKNFEDYVKNIKTAFDNDYRSIDIDYVEEDKSLRVFIPEMGIYNYYIYLDDSTMLVAEGSFDYTSLKSKDLIKEIESIYDKLEYDSSLVVTASQKLETARKAINVKNQGQKILAQFNKSELIYTDTIGVGTGPVDYYYLSGANHTLKIERSFDVILKVMIGRECEMCNKEVNN